MDTVIAVGSHRIQALTHEQGASSIEVFEFTIPAGSPGPAAHWHSSCDEFYYIIEGLLHIEIDGVSQELATGASAVILRKQVHLWHPIETTRALVSFSPAVGMVGYFQELGKMLQEGVGTGDPRWETLYQRYDQHRVEKYSKALRETQLDVLYRKQSEELA